MWDRLANLRRISKSAFREVSDYLTSGAAAGQPVDFKQVSGRMGYG
jgi:hypothetical protein